MTQPVGVPVRQKSRLVWRIRILAAVGCACLVFGLLGFIGSVLAPSPSGLTLRALLPAVLVFVGAVLGVVVGSLRRRAFRTGDLEPGRRDRRGLVLVAVGVAVGIVAATAIPIPVVSGFEIAYGPVNAAGVTLCYSAVSYESYSLPARSSVVVEWVLARGTGQPYVNVTTWSGSSVYQSEPGLRGSGSFDVPSSTTLPEYIFHYTIVACSPTANAYLDVWVNATQGGALL